MEGCDEALAEFGVEVEHEGELGDEAGLLIRPHFETSASFSGRNWAQMFTDKGKYGSGGGGIARGEGTMKRRADPSDSRDSCFRRNDNVKWCWRVGEGWV